MFQPLCSEKVDWDKELNEIWLPKWKSFLSELKALNNVRIPRCYFNANSKPNSIQLHGFNDTSKQAYTAVVYIWSSYNDGHVSVSLLCSKTRVSLVKQQTIPRLELKGQRPSVWTRESKDFMVLLTISCDEERNVWRI